MKLFWSWIAFHGLVFAACMAVMGLASLLFSISNWCMVGAGLWLIACYGALCLPDSFWDRWMSRREK